MIANSDVSRLLEASSVWTTSARLTEIVDAYFKSERGLREIEDFREKRGEQKRLRDEILLVLNFFRATGFRGDVRFALGNDPPDAWLRLEDGQEINLEVTVALARSQYELGRRLNKEGRSPGAPLLQDSGSSAGFSDWRNDFGRMASADSYFEVVEKALSFTMEKKNRATYCGFWLLVEVPVFGLSQERWTPIFERLRPAAVEMPFEEIHVVSRDQLEAPFSFKLK